MISSEQMPILIIIVPLLGAFLVNIAGCFNKKLCWPLTNIILLLSTYAAIRTLGMVMTGGEISYRLGGWPPPFGIEYMVDHLNGLVLVVINGISLLVALYSKKSVERELADKTTLFYTIFILLVCGLSGMTITGDAFNLYVLLEISALTGYALIAIGSERSLMASFNYLMLGTIGASLYLLGTGHLYIMTGSLNMGDLSNLLPHLYDTQAVFAAFALIMVGVWTKMAFFPLHTWLPNSYTHAPTATACLAAPLVTKVSVYIMLRAMFSIFTPRYVYDYLDVAPTIVWLAVAAIIGGSILALTQRDLKKMLTYLIVAEVGYMVGGAWLATRMGLTGTILHIVNDALMTLCLFMAAGAIAYKTGSLNFDNLKGLFARMPFTMAAFTLGALSMIGVPPTAGFFSKWYLLLGAIDAGQWGYMAALLFSSLVNAILFFRIFEIAFFESPTAEASGHGHETVAVEEAPLTMLAPLLLVAIGLVVLGLYSGDIVTSIIRYAIPIP